MLPVIQTQWTDFSQGALLPTHNSTDLALNGKGFFVASTPSGPLYTRDGSFRLSGAGQLQTQDGYAIQGSDGRPIVLDNSRTFEVTPEGEVRQDGQEISRVALVDFQDTAMLAKRGGNYFQSGVSGIPTIAGIELKSNRASSKGLIQNRSNRRPAWSIFCASSKLCRRRLRLEPI